MTSNDPSAGGIIRLNALIAGLQKMDGTLHGPVLRHYLEYGLERLQRLEEEHYAFLGECALLAADNLQDLRLQDLEQRVAKLERPDAPSWGETLTSIGTDIILQLLTLGALHGIAARVIAVMGAHRMGTTVREAATALASAKSVEESLARLAKDAETGERAYECLASNLADVGAGRVPDGGFPVPDFDGSMRPVRNMDEWIDRSWELVDRRETTRQQIWLARLQLMTEPSSVASAEAAYTAAKAKNRDENIAKYWKNWRQWLGDEFGNLLITPTNSLLAKLRADVFTPGTDASDSGNSGGAFQSSTISGRYLNWVRSKRLQIAEAYTSLRLFVRYAPDTQLKAGNEQIFSLARLISEALPQWEVLQSYAQCAQPWIVRGLEVAFWHDYLNSNRALDVWANNEFVTPNSSLLPGMVVSEHLIKEVLDKFQPIVRPGTDVELHTRQAYLADDYPGMLLLTDLQAEYLFHQFAKPYFVSADNRRHLDPFKYDPTDAARYQNLSALQDDWFWGTPNPERVARIAEMRFMVLVFFRKLETVEVDARLKDYLQGGSQLSVEDWFSQQPEGITPTVIDPQVAAEKTFDAGAAAFQARMEQTQLHHADELNKAELDLTDTIHAMQLLVTNYAMLAGGGSIELVGFPSGTTADSIAKQIDNLKPELKQHYDQAVKLAADDPKKSQEVTERFKPSFDFLSQWSAATHDDRAPEFNQQWHFSTEEEQPAP